MRKTALETVERHDFGGSYFDSYTHAAMFKTYKPHSFGVRTSQLFSSSLGSHMINKKFTYYTVAKNNVYMLPAGTDDYEWYLESDADIDFEVTELLVDPASFPGKAGLPFKIALNKDYLHEPAIIKSESDNLPMLKILGYPVQRTGNSWEYEVELQSGDPSAYMQVDFLQPGRKFIRTSSAVSDELNKKYAPDQYGEMFKLQSWTGNFANKVEFSDKFIRMEIGCRTKGTQMYKGYKDDHGIGVGYVYKQPFNLTNGGKAERIEKGVFITKAEARLLERTEMDRELNFEFGQLQKTVDRDSDRTIKVAPGWRQIVREGHYKEHNGTLSLNQIYEFVSEIFLTRRAHGDRMIKIASGEGGLEFWHQLIAAEASQFQYVDTIHVRDTQSPYHEYAKEYGIQFTKIRFPMGYVVELVHDPIKDDRKLFQQKAPGTNRTLESYAMDIFDWGATDQKAFNASRDENITCVMQDGVESYFTVSNVYDFQTGAIKDGSNAYSNNKEAGIYREMSGGLCVWDVTRVGRIEFNPYTVV